MSFKASNLLNTNIKSHFIVPYKPKMFYDYSSSLEGYCYRIKIIYENEMATINFHCKIVRESNAILSG